MTSEIQGQHFALGNVFPSILKDWVMFIEDGLEQSLLFLMAKPASCTFVPARVLAALTSSAFWVCLCRLGRGCGL